jgi:hypothetical protein
MANPSVSRFGCYTIIWDTTPQSAWNPHAGEDDPQIESWIAAPLPLTDAGGAP